jgi:hypothetical protein
MGDSKLVIDWANRKRQVEILSLGSITKAIGDLQSLFDWILFSHINREFNQLADGLSKQALLLHEGTLVELEFHEGVLQSELEERYP